MAKRERYPASTTRSGLAGRLLNETGDLLTRTRCGVQSLRDLIVVYDREIVMLERKIHHQLRDDRGDQAVQALNGVGRTIVVIFVTEIGDVSLFWSVEVLCSWAGLTPRHRESDTKVVRGGITKMGSRLVRWAALEAIARYHGGSGLHQDFRSASCNAGGTNKARVAVARKLLTLVYYGLRDGEIRCLRDNAAVAA